MKVKKRLLYAVWLAAMVCASLSGCGENTAPIASDNVSVGSEIQYNTIEPPDDGWTVELIDSVLYVDGKPFSMQSNINDFEGFVWNTEYEDDFYSLNGSKTLKTSYMTNGDHNLLVIVDMEGNILKISSATDMENFRFVDLSVNGVRVGSDYSEVISRLGIPDDEGNASEDALGYAKYMFSGTENDVCIRIWLESTEDGSSAVESIGINNPEFYVI